MQIFRGEMIKLEITSTFSIFSEDRENNGYVIKQTKKIIILSIKNFFFHEK